MRIFHVAIASIALLLSGCARDIVNDGQGPGILVAFEGFGLTGQFSQLQEFEGVPTQDCLKVPDGVVPIRVLLSDSGGVSRAVIRIFGARVGPEDATYSPALEDITLTVTEERGVPRIEVIMPRLDST
ncbi:MAG: hypothetical protein KTR21_14015, partial [Rhodobacteraceae bacterium]|nr:hypothetical protein [Paracoccaceae bacterium]